MAAVANLLLLAVGGLALYTIGKKPEGAVGPGPVYPPTGPPPGAPPAPAQVIWPPPGSPPIPTGVTFSKAPDVSVWSLPVSVPAPVLPGTLVWVEGERMMYEAAPGGWVARPEFTKTEVAGVVTPRETGAMPQYQALEPARARARELGLRR